MGSIRRILIYIVAGLMIATLVYVGVYVVQRMIVGDFSPVIVLGISILIMMRLLSFRRIGRNFSGLSGYRRNVPKDM